MRSTTLLSSLCLLGLAALSACNDAPVGPVLAIEPEAPDTSSDLVARMVQEASDPNERDTLDLTWTWSVDGAVQDDLTGDLVPASRTARDQTWTVEVVADDGKLLSEPVTASVTILNAPPTATVSLPAAATTTQDLVATASGEDLDQDTLSFSYSWTVDGTATSFDGDTVPAAETARGELWEVIVVASDGTAESEPATASITIENSAPSVAAAAVRPDPLREADTATCEGTGWQDPDGDPEQYVISWTVNGAAVSGETLDGSQLDKGDEVVCTLLPVDGDMEGTAVSSDPVVVQNTPPVVSGLSLSPAAPTVTTPVEAALAEVSDADGDEVSLTWSWTLNGTPLAGDASTVEPAWVRGDELVVSVTPSDDEAAGEVVSASVTIANAPPVIDSATITPAVLLTEDLATASYVVSDPDGDEPTVSFAWTVNGSAAGTASYLDGSQFDKGDTVGLTISVDDGHGGTASLSASTITVSNTPPTAPGVTLSPSDPSTSDDLICTLATASTDADDDRIRYTVSWTLDGSAWTGSTSTTTYVGDTIDAADLSDGDEWSCAIQASDGTDSATGTSSTVTVNDCGATSSSVVYGDTVQMYGYCWVLGRPGRTCDAVCADVGGTNLAVSAATAFTDSCSKPSPGDVSTWFYLNGNPAGWTSTGATGYKTLGYGYTGSQYYGKCAGGGSTGHGTWPGDPNNSSTRTLVCPCF